MADTVKARIVALFAQRLAAITGVAHVSMDTDELATFAGRLVDGAVIEVVAGDDEVMEEAPQGTEAFRFELLAIIHLPDPLPDGVTPAAAAADWHRRVCEVHSKAADPALNQWIDGGGTALAVRTRTLLGGGVSIDPQVGTRIGASLCEVEYRHEWGDQETPA